MTVCVWSRFHTTYTGTGVGHRLQRLTPATHYSLRIAASSDSGQGAWSDLLTCETLPTGPSAPLDLVMRWEDDVIVMSWEKVSHPLPVTYELQLKIGGQDFTQVGVEWEWGNESRQRCFPPNYRSTEAPPPHTLILSQTTPTIKPE